MKRYLRLLTVGAMLTTLASCGVDEDAPILKGSRSFTATTEPVIPVRTALDEGFNVTWSTRDQVAIITDAGIERAVVSSVNATGTEARISADITGSQLYCTISPFSAAVSTSGSIVNVNIPTAQSATAGNYDPAAMVSYSRVEGSKLSFKNAVALLEFSVASDDAITGLTIEADQDIAGPVSVNLEDNSISGEGGSKSVSVTGPIAKDTRYFIAIRPGTFSTFTVTFTRSDGTKATATRTAVGTVSRSSHVFLGDFNIPAEKWVGSEAWYVAKYEEFIAERKDAGQHTSSKTHVMGKKFEGLTITAAKLEKLADPNWEPTATMNYREDTPKAYLRPYKVASIFPNGMPSPKDVNQGSLPDCGALAMLADLAYMCPQFVKDMVRADTDSTFVVKMYLPDGTRTEVGVKSTFLANDTKIIQCTGKNNNPCWSSILEKALFKYNEVFDKFNPIGGTGPVPIIAMLTGRGECVDYKPKIIGEMSADQMREIVDVMLHNHRFLMVMFQEAVTTPENAEFGNVNTVTAHAYSGMYSSNPGAIMAVRNPWGFNNKISNTPGEGVMNIIDDEVKPLIELRVMFPGDDAIPYMVKPLKPYR
ncbi:MAG: hypothetical protein IJS07_07830 [Bacteroidales bacterium]|nr:hypothetical protein [Bacteroidales bacterium]